FLLSLRTPGPAIHEPPTLHLERLNWLGMVQERKQLPYTVANLPRPWAEGWDGKEFLLVELSTRGLTDGKWRIRARGTVGGGKERTEWASEPKLFTVKTPPRNAGRGGGGIKW